MRIKISPMTRYISMINSLSIKSLFKYDERTLQFDLQVGPYSFKHTI